MAGILLVLAGLVQTGRMFRDEYRGPLPPAVKGFSPILTGAQAAEGAPPLTSRPAAPLRSRAAALASLPAHRGMVPASAAATSPAPPAETAPVEAGSAPPASGSAPPASSSAPPASSSAPPAADRELSSGQPAPTATAAGPAIPDWLDIPVIELSAPVVAVEPVAVRVSGLNLQQWSAPDLDAAGWHSASALLGQPGNTVLNGHHNIYGSVFARLHELQPGDELFVWAKGRAYLYQVDQVLLLEERYAGLAARTENARWILPSDDERLTLVTCWPPESNTHRVIVVARPMP